MKVYLPNLKRTSNSPLYLPSNLAPAVTIMSRNCGPLLRSGLRVNRASVPQMTLYLVYRNLQCQKGLRTIQIHLITFGISFSLLNSQVLSRWYRSHFIRCSSVELCRLLVGFVGNRVFLDLNLQRSPCGI